VLIASGTLIHKYLLIKFNQYSCFGDIPKSITGECNLEHYSSVLEMYTNLCTVLCNCIIHSPDFASIVTFSSEFIRHLFGLINKDLYCKYIFDTLFDCFALLLYYV
jgi:hypothetical protein